jgi:hypothetical protein
MNLHDETRFGLSCGRLAIAAYSLPCTLFVAAGSATINLHELQYAVGVDGNPVLEREFWLLACYFDGIARRAPSSQKAGIFAMAGSPGRTPIQFAPLSGE